MLNYNHLYYFYEVAKFGSISHAAKYLNLSQPSLSIQIKTLEGNLGFKLIEKKGRNIALTEKGQKVFSQFSRAFQSTQDLFSRIDNKDMNKSLKIGINFEVEPAFILEVSQKVLKKVSHLDRVNLSLIKEEHLLDRDPFLDLDMYITNRKSTESKVFFHFKTINIPINLFQSRVHKVSEGNLILPGKDLVLRDETEFFLAQNTIEHLTPVIETDFVSSIVRSVIDGFGVSYLPISYMLEPMQEGLVMKSGPKKGYWQHSLFIYWKKQDFLADWIFHFYKILSHSIKG